MSLDEYVQGKANKNTFCYWVERETSDLGHIQGARADKFGIYYSKKKGAFRFTKKYTSKEEARERILSEIDDLLTAGERGDVETIRESPISPMFAGKILFLYFPTKFINIFSARHVDHYLSRLRADEPGAELDLISKKDRLLQIKNSDEVMKGWMMFEFSDFLYTAIQPPPPRGAAIAPTLREHLQAYPPVDETEPEFINLPIGESPDPRTPTAPRRGGVTDFDKRNRRNKLTGNQGEDVVLKAERQRLKRGGRPDLAKDAKRVSEDDDAAGFDILSFELDGSEKYIEVKSTTGKAPNPNGGFQFHLSANELQQARQRKNYQLYLVFEVASLKPKILSIPNPASLEPKRLFLKPSAYHATITIA